MFREYFDVKFYNTFLILISNHYFNLQLPIKFIAARTQAEFKVLLANPTINNLTGYIALVSQSSVFRGAIAEWTGQLGAAGLLSYPDPRDGYNLEPNLTYPNGRFLPSDAAIVGVMSDYNGDFLTPGLPAIDRKHYLHTIFVLYNSRHFIN